MYAKTPVSSPDYADRFHSSYMSLDSCLESGIVIRVWKGCDSLCAKIRLRERIWLTFANVSNEFWLCSIDYS